VLLCLEAIKNRSKWEKSVGTSKKVYDHSSFKENIYVPKHTNYHRQLIYLDSVAKGVHPTKKPVKLLEYLIRTYSNEGDTVLDFTMGSGSTGFACLNTNRKYVGIELEKEYYDIARDRLEQASKSRQTKLI